jgi:acyl carrier protein
VVPQPGIALDVAGLRDQVRTVLPDYMVPATIAPLAALPLTPNGKVDRRALPAPAPQVLQGPGAPRPVQDTFETQLARIFERVLGLPRVSISDSFFDLGGHSLLAMRLFTEIESVFGRNLPLATLFEAPSVEQLAAVLRREGWSAPWNSLVALQPHGTRAPFFCVHSLGSNLSDRRRRPAILRATAVRS